MTLDDGKLLKHSNCRLVDAAPPSRLGFLTIRAPGTPGPPPTPLCLVND
jgi:hypothetical protein